LSIFNACHFQNWDIKKSGTPAIQIDAGKAIIQGCTFAREGISVRVGEKVRSTILVGNQAKEGFRVVNQAENRTQMMANEEPAPAAK